MSSSADSVFLNKVSFVFNKVLLNLVKELRTKNDVLKRQLKIDYGTFDKFSPEYIVETSDEFHKNSELSSALNQPYELKNLESNDDISNMKFIRNFTLKNIINEVDELEHAAIYSYLYTMYFMTVLRSNVMENKFELDVLNDLLLKSVKINSQVRVDLDNIDESFKQLMQNMIECNRDSTSVVKKLDVSDILDDSSEDSNHDNMINSAMEFLNNSKIGELAKEIAEEVDFSKIDVSNQEKLFDIDAMFSGEKNNGIGDMIGTVGQKITSKLQNGDLDQTILMNEALQMMSKMKMNNPLINNMMNNMMGGQNSDMPDFSSILKELPKNK